MKEAILFEKINCLTAGEDGVVKALRDMYVAVAEGDIQVVTQDRAAAVATLPPTFLSYRGQDKLLLPAFANAHTHLPMSLLRNSADDLRLHEWLYNNIFPREAKMRPEDIRVGTELSLLELIAGGVVCLADMYMMPEETAGACLEAGVRLNFCCESRSTGPSGYTEMRPDWAEAAVRDWEGRYDDRFRVSLLIHSVYLHQPEIYPLTATLAKSLGVGIHLHLSETQKENADCLKDYGLTPTAKLVADGIFDVPTLAAHCVWLSAEDRTILREKKVACSHNPTSNLKLGSGIAEIGKLVEEEIRVCLGTDGAASNNRLDLYAEMRLAALLAKGKACDPVALTADQVFKMATVEGYRSLRFDRGGIIAAGEPADLQVLCLSDPNLQPPASLLSAVVYSAGPENVESTLCNGEFLFYKGMHTTLDAEKITAEAGARTRFLSN